MSEEVDCTTIMTALELWDRARFQSKHSQVCLGEKVLERLFELHPKAKHVFGFQVSEAHGRARTALHARALVNLFDSVLQCLGPDLAFTERILAQLADKHKALGVTPAMITFLGQAFADTFQQQLDSVSTEEAEAWAVTYEAIGHEIIRNLLLGDDDNKKDNSTKKYAASKI